MTTLLPSNSTHIKEVFFGGRAANISVLSSLSVLKEKDHCTISSL